MMELAKKLTIKWRQSAQTPAYPINRARQFLLSLVQKILIFACGFLFANQLIVFVSRSSLDFFTMW